MDEPREYTITKRVTSDLAYSVVANSPEEAYRMAMSGDTHEGEARIVEIHNIFVSYWEPDDKHGWRHVRLDESDLNLDEES